MEVYRFNFVLNNVQRTQIQNSVCIWQGWWRFIMMDMLKTLSPKMFYRKTGFFAQYLNRISNSSVNISKYESQSPLVLGIYWFRLKNSKMFAIQQKITLAAGYRYRTCQTLNKLRSMQTQFLLKWKLDSSIQCSHKINIKKFFHFFCFCFISYSILK